MDGLQGKRIAIYARYSSDSQREASIEDQVRVCRAYIERHGGTFCPDLVFADSAISGASMARASLERLMQLVRAVPPAIDIIVTEDLSRVTRALADGAALYERLRFAGVALIGVNDGIDTSARGAKLAVAMSNIKNDLYRDDLSDKTARGLVGRQAKGYSTGNPPFGYTSSPETDSRGGVIGYRLALDPEKAAVVRRVFDLYVAGRSLTAIAKTLCSDGVPPPRAGSRHRRKGWCGSTIRAMLHNKKYIGVWNFREREWVRVPGENRRVCRPRPTSDVVISLRAELRIIDQQTWEASLARLAAVHDHYTRNPDGTPKGRASAGKQNQYLLSGLLTCGVCGAPMIINGGGSYRYYRCTDAIARGTCPNRLGVKEAVARTRILDAVRETLQNPSGIAYARKQFAEVLGKLTASRRGEVAELRHRITQREGRIQNLVSEIADGNHSERVRAMLWDLESQQSADQRRAEELDGFESLPVQLPSPEEIARLVFDLDTQAAADPIATREALRRLLQDGRIILEPGTDGVYTARTMVLPLVFLAEKRNRRSLSGPPVSNEGSGG